MTKAQIFYHDIGDYLTREKKLEIIKEFGSVKNVPWQTLTPNEHGDWISKRNSIFETFIPLAPEKKFDVETQSFFTAYSLGLATNRDSWVCNFSKTNLSKNMKNMIDFYNSQIGKKELDMDESKISWTVNLKEQVEKLIKNIFDKNSITIGMYRPFCKQNLYFNRSFIERPGLWLQLFPSREHKNVVICTTGIGVNKDFSVLITDILPDLQLQANGQCFPLYYYTKKENKNQAQGEFFEGEAEYTRQNGVSDFIFSQAKERYGNKITREDIFYYVYGMLHSPSYRKTFANDLKKMLPRLPLVEKAEDFWAFSKAGRNLAALHLNYEEQEKPKEVEVSGIENGNFIVSKMEFLAKGKKDIIRYNSDITISNIPAKAYEYIVNGKSAVEWIMERYAATTHKESGIKNNPNDWAMEHNEPRYILDLLLSVVTVSVKTAEIVEGLPEGNYE